MKTNYLTQTFHEYIRKKLSRRNVNISNRKTMKKTTFIIENIEKNPFIFDKTKIKTRSKKIQKNANEITMSTKTKMIVSIRFSNQKF